MLCLYCVHVGCGNELAASPMCTWSVFPGLDDNHLPPSITELQKEWCHSSTLPYIFMALCWINPARGKYYTFIFLIHFKCVSGSSVGIATDCGPDGPGIESQWGRDFSPVQIGPGPHSASCKMGTGSFSGVKCGRGVLLTTHHLLVPRSWKSRAIPLHTLWATPGL